MTLGGVFLCTCDQRVEKSIDVDAVQKAVERARTPNVSDEPLLQNDMWHAYRVAHVCQPDGLTQLKAVIREEKLDRALLAACPARFQEKRLCAACTDAGIQAHGFGLVDWREGCAWAHRGDREGATARAVDLVQMGIARLEFSRPLGGTSVIPQARVAVIGGGIAGMTAARALADSGVPVTLIEQDASLGGQLASRPADSAACSETLNAVLYHPGIDLRLNARLTGVSGTAGALLLQVEGRTRSDRLVVAAGAVVVATGAREYLPVGLYRYDGRRVATLGDFERQLAHPPLALTDVVYILCAGSRDERNAYCSATCCLAALEQAMRVKRDNPGARVTLLFRDLYLLGDDLNEERVREARRVGVDFIRYTPEQPPYVEEEAVLLCDRAGEAARRIRYDRLILATPQVPRDNAGVLVRLLGLQRDEHGFFVEPHQRLRPERRAERGIYVCGSAHRPVDVDTAILQGQTAAAQAARFVKGGERNRPTWSAWVDQELCTGCGQCVQACGFGAIRLRRAAPIPATDSGTAGPDVGGEFRSSVNPALCVACGNCAASCPSRAIDLPESSHAQILAQIDAALATRSPGALRTLVFACTWSGHAAMELAGARRLAYPAGTRVIELPCSARLDPLHVLYALVNGPDQVLVALCPPDECHFGNGNSYAETRIERLRAQVGAHGIDPRRLRVVRMMGDDAKAWVRAVTETQIPAENGAREG